MMVVPNDFKYAGDLSGVGAIYHIDEDTGKKACEF